MAALALTSRASAHRQPDRTLAKSWVKGAIALGAVQELVMDKLPRTPSRLIPPSFVARVAVGSGVGVIAARRAEFEEPVPGATAAEAAAGEKRRLLVMVAVSTAAAIGTTLLGARYRAFASNRFGTDWPGALVEDAAAIALSAWATRA
jgi:uncharacterized membrane protein